ncbi:MAG: hypothetical protein E7588_09660 [Ruminococcaceae bacterium]|nr:hypothetical protein [Oscillospiraceae bacterium]
MKKFLIFCAVLVLLCISAFAVETVQPENGKYSVRYNAGTENIGQQYILFAVKGHDADSVNFDDIVYIGYAECNSDGYAVFDPFIPMNVCNATLLVTGGHLDKPHVYGIISPAVGSVKCYGAKNAQIRLYSGNTLIETAVTDENGNYMLARALRGQQYRIAVIKDGYLGYTALRTASDEGIISEIDITRFAGDLDGSGKILINDLNSLFAQLGNSGDGITLAAADFNSDGTVDVNDINILVSNYNRTDTEE